MVVHMNHAIFYYLIHPYQLLGKNVFAVDHVVLFFFVNSNTITSFYDLYIIIIFDPPTSWPQQFYN